MSRELEFLLADLAELREQCVLARVGIRGEQPERIRRAADRIAELTDMLPARLRIAADGGSQAIRDRLEGSDV